MTSFNPLIPLTILEVRCRWSKNLDTCKRPDGEFLESFANTTSLFVVVTGWFLQSSGSTLMIDIVCESFTTLYSFSFLPYTTSPFRLTQTGNGDSLKVGSSSLSTYFFMTIKLHFNLPYLPIWYPWVPTSPYSSEFFLKHPVHGTFDLELSSYFLC